MQPSQLTLRRGLDEVVLEALASQPQLPAARPSDSDVSIEVVFEDDSVDVDDLAVTNRFVRFSAPYERVEVEELGASLASLRRVGVARPRTFVKTVPVPIVPPPSATLSFDKVWFEQPEEALALLEDPAVDASSRWWWLLVTMMAVAAGVALVFAAVYAAG